MVRPGCPGRVIASPICGAAPSLGKLSGGHGMPAHALAWSCYAEAIMLRWALVFLIAAILTALVGLSGRPGTFTTTVGVISQVLLVLCLLALIRSFQRPH